MTLQGRASAGHVIMTGALLAYLGLAACNGGAHDGVAASDLIDGGIPSDSDAGDSGCADPFWGNAFEAGIYPQGVRFGLVLVGAEILDSTAMQEAWGCGWNVADSYETAWWSEGGISLDFITRAASEGFLAWGSLAAQNYFAGCGSSVEGCSPFPESEMSTAIGERAASGSVAWWSLPEEMRWWYPGEMDVVSQYASWTRTYDPAQHPNLMYIPSHYGADSVAQYVPALDVVPASLYSQYKNQPYAWTRWRMESTVQAIRDAGAELGRDYLHGQKTPAAYLELFDYREASFTTRPTTPEGSAHDFWQAIVSGARGLMVYAHGYRNRYPEMAASWSALCNAARNLTGEEGLEEAILEGDPVPNVSLELLAGPARTPTFVPYDGAESIDFPTTDALALRRNGEVFVIVVSSAEDEGLRVAVHGLPPAARADVLFEGRTLPLADGSLEDDVAPLGVHVYRVREAP